MQRPLVPISGPGRANDDTSQRNVGPSSGSGSIYIAGHARVHLGDNHNVTHSEDAARKLLKSFAYPQMFTRAQQITASYPATCEWLLKPASGSGQRWDCFLTWLTSSEQGPLYWIHGKPGSGKSTILKFIDQDSRAIRRLSSMTDERQIIKARHYFWKGGNVLQKSLEGLCRVILTQLVNQVPNIAADIYADIQHIFYDIDSIEWNVHALSSLLLNTLTKLSEIRVVFLLIDGLDECDSLSDQELLIDVLHRVMSLPNVKLCVTSRPENIFRDAFHRQPQLRLEDLTHADIQLYITRQLSRSPRWSGLSGIEVVDAEALVSDIISRAQGVFLWVTLAMRDMLRGLSDGETMCDLRSRVSSLPADLNDYFLAILDSIQPNYRRDASVLLQLALFEEGEFGSVYTLHLADTLFVSETSANFVLSPDFDHNILRLDNEAAFHSRMDIGLRRLSSRSKGLLECNFAQTYLSTPRSLSYFEWLRQVLSINVNFLHRSLRDFLLLPHIQEMLYSLTDGKPINARQYLINARIVQMLALNKLQYTRADDQTNQQAETDENLGNLTVGLASHILSALSVNGPNTITSQICSLIRPTLEEVADQFDTSYYDYWYINNCLEVWDEEGSNFLTLAIDFGLTAYVKDNMTIEDIQHKEGRPVLSYILEPRFGNMIGRYGLSRSRYSRRLFNNISPTTRLNMLLVALAKGADPNVSYNSEYWSVWSQYLCDTARLIQNNLQAWKDDLEEQTSVHAALSALIDAGAMPIMTIAPLADSHELDWEKITLDVESYEKEHTFLRFVEAWEEALPVELFLFDNSSIVCTVSSLLSFLSQFFQLGLGTLIEKLQEREAELQLMRWGRLRRNAGTFVFSNANDNMGEVFGEVDNVAQAGSPVEIA